MERANTLFDAELIVFNLESNINEHGADDEYHPYNPEPCVRVCRRVLIQALAAFASGN